MHRIAFLIGFLLVACAAAAQDHISDYDDSVRVGYQLSLIHI